MNVLMVALIVGVVALLPIAAAAALAVWMAYTVYHPAVPKRDATPADFGLAYELIPIEVTGRTPVLLDAWWIPCPRAPHTILIMHEWGSQKADKLLYARFLRECGFNVLLFDLRNHGASAKDSRTFKMAPKYTGDLLAVVDRWRTLCGDPAGRLGILAFSFSTWPVLHYAAVYRPLEVAALVLDSGPPLHIGRTAIRFIDLYGRHWIPAVFRMPVLLAVLKRVYVYSLKRMLHGRWPPAMTGVRAATLFITGDEDLLMPPHEVASVAALVGGERRVWVVPRCGHLKAFKRREAEYKACVQGFFASHLASASSESAGSGQLSQHSSDVLSEGVTP